jgi:diguanylate cyclase (GGDEF)-like protein
MARGHDFPLDYHRMLLDDFYRVDCYDRAIRELVRPGDVVLDVGTGSGILALLAARRGARVHAVESMPVARLARELVQYNGLADRVTVHEADLVEMEPVEPVDLVIGEWMGRFLVDDRMFDAVAAASRWLKPGGRCCPSEVRLRLAPVADFHFPAVELFRRPQLGVDLEPAVRIALNGVSQVWLSPRTLLADPVDWHRWSPPLAPAPFEGRVTFHVYRGATLSGIAGFFAADLAKGIALHTAPGFTTHWGQVLFHIEPTRVEPGDELTVDLALLPGEDLDFRWTVIQSRSGREVWRDTRYTAREIDAGPAPAPPEICLDPLLEHTRATRAFRAGRIEAATAAWERATTALTPADDALACRIYEALGTCYQNLGEPRSAIRAFLRALDGDSTSREKSLRRLVECAGDVGMPAELARWTGEYEAAFGPFPSNPALGPERAERLEEQVTGKNHDRDELTDDEETTAFSNGPPPDADDTPVDNAPWLIVMSGRSVGRMFRLQPGEVTIGRSPTCTVVVDDEGVSREHARISVSADGPNRLWDLDSRNGTFVEETRIGKQSVPLREGNRIRLGPATILKIGRADELEQQVMVQLYHAATRDGLTGLFNKRFFFEALDQEVAWHRRHGQPLSLILGDVDLFKEVNTRYGHPVGDEVLKEVAARLLRVCRAEDVVARYGGEEFVVILRHTAKDAALQLAERLRARLDDTPMVVGEHSVPVTASFGVATRSGDELRGAELLSAADECLREAKLAGRNLVKVAEP